MGGDNVTRNDATTRMSQNFIWDETHLTEESDKNFIDSNLKAVLIFFGAEIIEQEDK
jgi:hypothetical protein